MSRSILFALLLFTLAFPFAHGEAENRSSYDRWVDDLWTIEDVYWQNRIWPSSNPGPKPDLTEVLDREVIDARARRVLNILDEVKERWNLSVDAHRLQLELDRLAANTRAPNRLEQLFAALDHDPLRLARALALPTYANRLAAQLRLTGTTPPSNTDVATGHAVLEDWMPIELPPIVGRQGFGPEAGTDTVTCTDDTWDTFMEEPTPRGLHTAVWTGSEMIIWGGSRNNEIYNSGGIYDPATDSWTAMSTQGAPAGKESHTAVWTGTEMIVWGGTDAVQFETNTGGRYNPTTDTWTPTSTTGAPEPRVGHVSVWTGTEMIIWGGDVGLSVLGPGGRYDPSSDTWTPMSDSPGPEQRPYAVAVWTGSEMLINGGGSEDASDPFELYDDLWRYSPSSNSWTSAAPMPGARRTQHAGVWTDSELLVWGGLGLEYDPEGDEYLSIELDDGWRFNPASGSWTAMGTAGSLPSARYLHTAVWTGNEMIVYGGFNGFDGGAYNPSADFWSFVPENGQGNELVDHTAVWTDSEMIIWGGTSSTFYGGIGEEQSKGSRFDPVSGVWTPVYSSNPPPSRKEHTAVWTGSEMIVHGGSGVDELLTYRYDPALNIWTVAASSGITEKLTLHTAVWTGSEMIVWGGLIYLAGAQDDGGRYNPTTDTWTAADQTNAPAPRYRHYAGWTGTEMIVYDGSTGDSTGGLYDPATDSWRPMTTVGAPSSRSKASAVVADGEFIIWGGGGLGDGARYDWVADSWTPVTTVGAPSARGSHSAIWTGTEMIIWGGSEAGTQNPLSDGSRYDPTTDSWTPISVIDAPPGRHSHVAVWTGSEMLVWGGQQGIYFPDQGGRYDPGTDSWTLMSLEQTPVGRYQHTGVWSGSEMLIFGGSTELSRTSLGGRYCAASCTATDWYRDNDNDGVGDSNDVVSACTAPEGYVGTGGDCNDADPDVWSTPSETRDMLLTHDKQTATTTIQWSEPANPGANSVTYDLLRSLTASDFNGADVCFESDDVDLMATDATTPANGTAYHYLSRAVNSCPLGDGDLGSDSQSTPRTGAPCP